MSRRASRPVQARALAPLFAALGDETRLSIVGQLSREGPLSIARLAEDKGVTRQAVSKHLKALLEAGLVSDAREGRERIYELTPRRVLEAQRCLESISAQWDIALGRLRELVEK